MFNSSKIIESPRKLNNSLLSPNEETVNETSRSFAFPKITSTPRTSIFATPPKSLVLTPRRYSLSEIATPPRNNRREFIRSNSSQSPPGPLLASTKYNINVSTFEDVKSPGLTNRIVQYNEEVESERDQRRHATHQTKYGSLGLFPVVHLFKKKLPLLEQKRRHVTVRVASPDYMKHTPEYNRRIFDGIVKPSGTVLRNPHSSFSENPTSTRSVLDALKEISRKRIHANEELELQEETGKRIRTETEDCIDSNKRLRDDSPLLETTSPTRQVSKKICMYDEYAASRSSMDFLRKPDSLVPKRKSISISTITENSKDSKQVKLINAETQTIAEEETNKIESKEDDNNKDIENEKSEKVETVLKVFDDAPLERIRKNRLAALMGALVGKDPVLEPKPDYSSILQDETDKPESQAAADKLDKPLVSILTPTNKSPIKSDKHVRFNIPESISQNSNTVTSTEKIITETSDILENKKVENVPSPLVSTDSTPTISVASAPVTISTPSFPFGPKPTSNSLPSLFPNKPEIQSTTSIVSDSSKPSVIKSSITTSSPPKVGGFKFDIAKPAPTVSNSNTFMYDSKIHSPSSNNTTSIPSFGTSLVNATVSSNSKAETKINTAGESFPKITSPFAGKVGDATEPISKPSFSFGPVSAPSSNSFNFDGTKTASAPTSSNADILFGTTSSTNIGFSTVTTSAKTSFSTFTSVANKNLITSPSVTSNFSGTSASAQPSFGTTLTSVSSLKSSSFGNVNTTNTPNFGMANTTSAPSFGIAKTTSVPTFGIASTTTTPTFGNINTTNSAAFGLGNNTNTGGFVTNPTFGNSNNPSNNGFGASTTPVNGGFGTSTNLGGFGISATPVGFGTSTTSSGFGTPTTSGGFGTSTSSAGNNFGSSTTPGFGPFTTSASNMFGISTPTTSSSSFGTNVATTLKPMTNSSFTAPNINSGFGTSVTSGNGFSAPTTTGGGFNAGNFGTPTNSATFGATTTAAFGFGATNTTSVSTFGAPPTTTINTGFGTSNTGFGANSGSLFGNPNMPSFGGSSNTPSFGSTSSGSFSDAAFGAVTTTSSVFGPTSTTTPSSFTNDGNNKIFGGTAATFGTPTTNAMFGTTPSPFGGTVTTTASSALPFAFNPKTTANTTFGNTNTTSSFGFGSNTAGFGNQQSSSFGTPNKAPIFGNTNVPAFGGSTSTTPGFGTTTQQQPFGSTGSVFNKPQSPPNAFGAGQQFSFVQQQNNTNNFGTKTANPSAGVFTFGPGPAEKPGGFNFGPTSTDTPKKFDFTGAPAAPPAFGASFGNTPAPALPNFGAAASPAVAGGFSIGAGPPASNRPRPMIKGKRRT